MLDNSNTSGFLCHTCVWQERAESHELMDIPTLMRHGQRYHYLQQSQMTDYLRSSYRVCRSSTKHDECPPVLREQLPQVSAPSFELPERLVISRSQNPTRDDVQDFGAPLPAKVDKVEEMSLLKDEAANYPMASNDAEGHEAAVYFGETAISLNSFTSWTYGDLEWASGSWDNCSYPLIPSSTFNESAFRSCGVLFTPEHLSDPGLDFSELGHSLSMHPMFLPDSDGLLKEAMTLAGLDDELARLPVFDTQLEEYKECCGAGRGGLGSLDAGGGALKAWEGDRLQVWPEKAAPNLETSGGLVKGTEEEDEILWLPSHQGNFGEAGEYMDMRDMA